MLLPKARVGFGLGADLRRRGIKADLVGKVAVENGPLPNLSTVSECCGRSPLTGYSCIAQNMDRAAPQFAASSAVRFALTNARLETLEQRRQRLRHSQFSRSDENEGEGVLRLNCRPIKVYGRPARFCACLAALAEILALSDLNSLRILVVKNSSSRIPSSNSSFSRRSSKFK